MTEETKTILVWIFLYLQIFGMILTGFQDDKFPTQPPPKPKREIPLNSYGGSILLSLNKKNGEKHETE